MEFICHELSGSFIFKFQPKVSEMVNQDVNVCNASLKCTFKILHFNS